MEKQYITLRVIEFLQGKKIFARKLKILKEKIKNLSNAIDGCIFDNEAVFEELFSEMFENLESNPLEHFKKYSLSHKSNSNFEKYFTGWGNFSVTSEETVVFALSEFDKTSNKVKLYNLYNCNPNEVRRIFSKKEKESILNLS